MRLLRLNLASMLAIYSLFITFRRSSLFSSLFVWPWRSVSSP